MKTWKGFALLLCLAIATTLVVAGDKAMKTHKMNAEIVSVDVEGKMLVVKDEKGEEHKAPVMGKAVESLKMWKAGDKVTLTCQDKEGGEHEGVVAIAKAEPAPAVKK